MKCKISLFFILIVNVIFFLVKKQQNQQVNRNLIEIYKCQECLERIMKNGGKKFCGKIY